MASGLVAVPRDQICNAIKYLILRSQEPDGRFEELGKIYHKEMIVCFLIGPFANLPTKHSHQRRSSQRNKIRISCLGLNFRVT